MPYFLSIGVSREEFDDSTPIELRVYNEAERMRQKREDYGRWQQGMYFYSAVSTAIARGFSKGSKAEYINEPFSEKVASKADEHNMTEEEKSIERNKLLMALQTMQANFELNHGKDA